MKVFAECRVQEIKMTSLTTEQLIDALEAAVQHENLQEFSIVIQRLHNSSFKKKQNKIIQRVDELIDKYPSFNWQDSLIEIKHSWLLDELLTKHPLKLEGEMYRQLVKFFNQPMSPKSLNVKEIEALMDELINKLLRDFLQSQQAEA